jgi:aspartate carbamoyltransferase regulatory subunit
MRNSKIIGYIEKGIVIDHIPKGKVWTIATKILGIDKLEEGEVSAGDNYRSEKLPDKKGILKIEGITLSIEQLNYIALLSEVITVNFIENGKVKEKINLRIPSQLEGIVVCANAGCISRDSYQEVTSKIFYDQETEFFKCHYCNHSFKKDDVRLLF